VTERGCLLTLSATYGAGGTIVGPRLAETLALPFANRLSAARDLPPLPSEHASADELADVPRSRFLDGLALLSADWNIPAPADPQDLPDHVRTRLLAGLEELIASGGAVVLGRAAALALGRRPRVFHVRLDGPVGRRAERGAMWEGIDVDTARKRLEETDTARTRYVRSLYRCDPADPSLYHLVVDSTVLSVDACVEVVASAARAAWSFDRLADGDAVR
jgi:hypothetical protein